MQSRHVKVMLLGSMTIVSGCSKSYVPVASRAEVLAEITGDDAFEWAGLSVADIGDVNGDKKDDIVIGALAAPPGGRVAAFYGPVSGAISMRAADVVMTGELTFSNAGQALVHAGHCDVDGDGFDDVLIGAPFADRTRVARQANISGDNAGRAYLIFGSASLPADLSLANSNVIFVGEKEYDAAGFTVACAGDLDADGKSDLAISAPRAAEGDQKGVGKVYIVYGAERSRLNGMYFLENADAVLVGEAAFDNAGGLVAPVGDLDGDTLSELAVAAFGNDAGGRDSGAVYFLKGQKERRTGKVSLAEQPRLVGARAGERLGSALAAIGDFNGDGRADAALGISPVGGAVEQPGRAYVFLGGTLPQQGAVDQFSVVLEGEPSDAAGIGIAALGDLTRDGFADLAVGASFGQGDNGKGGRSYFVQGRTLSAGSRLALSSSFTMLQAKGDTDSLGEVVQPAGDINQDGFVDVMIAARGARTAQDGAGMVSIVSGKGLAAP
jgi:hypothetical protein